MAADEIPPSRAFLTAAQSLQHLATNARLGDAGRQAGISEDAPTKVYQQAPRETCREDARETSCGTSAQSGALQSRRA